jgi:hypothetical protein
MPYRHVTLLHQENGDRLAQPSLGFVFIAALPVTSA